MKNSEIADVLDEIAALLESRRENRFKIRAYRNAASTILDLPESVEELARQGHLQELPGIGEAICKKVTELVETGRLEYLERLKAGEAGETDG